MGFDSILDDTLVDRTRQFFYCSGEARMIINHRFAHDYLHKINDVNSEIIGQVNEIVLNNLHSKAGIFRSYGDVLISGSSYIPTSNGKLLEEYFNIMIVKSKDYDCLNQAFYLFSRLPYLQPYFDGNKRTSRLLRNNILLQNNICPLSFYSNRHDYIKSLLGFYELVDDSYLRYLYY
ncbi:MAG: hypothetical protein HON94_08485 [Methylococcales bacterium]|jgi:Fic family protein|nr:hypothetical protein [Methylococcales bacterium]MBT7409957.1 hypothetical protein [Methylococcales bacterium]